MERKPATKQGKTIKLRPKTVERIEKLRHHGQTYDGIVTELIDYFEQKEGKGK